VPIRKEKRKKTAGTSKMSKLRRTMFEMFFERMSERQTAKVYADTTCVVVVPATTWGLGTGK
jgi:hypothetical protein